MNKPILHIQQLDKTFNQTPILKAINLTLQKGEILFLLGASGCGKTTLLRTIAGFEKADRGEIWLQQRQIVGQNLHIPTEQRKLGYVVQEGVLFPHFNVYRNIAYGLGDGKGNKPAEQERIKQMMQLTGITDLADRMPHQLSGGQQQRVALARALTPDPDLILLDEPFSALDEHLRQQIRTDMLNALRASQKSAIFVTHDRDEALCYADKIAVIINGEIVQLANVQESYWQPQNLTAAQFLGDNIILTAKLLNSSQTPQAQCALGMVPVHPVAKRHTTQGQLLLRPEQFQLCTQATPNAIYAEIIAIQPKGKTSLFTLNVNQITIQLEQPYLHEFHVGDKLPLQINGKAMFYPDEIHSS